MNRLALTLAACCALGTTSVAADDAPPTLATVSYRRSPSFYNGENVPGVWQLKPGDVVGAGDGRAYVTAVYADSSRISARPNSTMVFHPGWIEMQAGGFDVDLVAGTPHLTQVETPLGVVALDGTTAEFYCIPPTIDPTAAAPQTVRITVRAGSLTFQLTPRPADGAAPGPPRSIVVDAGDRVIATVAEQGRRLDLQVFAGEVVAKLGGAATVRVPASSRGGIVFDPAKKVFELSPVSGEWHVVDAAGKPTTVAAETTHSAAVTAASNDVKLIASRRSELAAKPVAPTSPTVVEPPAVAPAPLTQLPDRYAYQRTLRAFLGGLTERDLDPGLPELTVAEPSADVDELYRTWLLSLDLVPLVGRKRCAASVSAPARLFLLDAIESPEGVCRPPAWPEPVAWLAGWDYPGNAYYGSRALKLRAFVTASVLLMMVDHAQENTPEIGVGRSDWLSHHLVLFGYTYLHAADVVPDEAKEAYRYGLRKLAQRVVEWGPERETIGMDMAAAVGMHFVAEALDDPTWRAAAESYARKLFTDRDFFHPAGYFVTLGGYDSSHNGSALYYAVWLAMTSDYPFVREPLEKAYRLRAHLSLPEPDGTVSGPTHFNPLASRGAYNDSYAWRYRDYAAAMLTDEAAHLTRLPTADDLAAGGEKRIKELKAQIKENTKQLPTEQLTADPWSFRPWPNSWSFPNVINYAQDAYRAGAYEHRAKLETERSPLLQLPFARDENFVRSFAKAFTVGKNDRYGVVLHVGPIGRPLPGVTPYPGPYGFGGGQLSAFWTPTTGAIICGRRGGMNNDANFDRLEDWRRWPIHAASGLTHGGKVLTTAQIRRPEVYEELGDDHGTVRVHELIPQEMFDQGKVLEAPIEYYRTFEMNDERFTVETRLAARGQDKLQELVETIPVYLRDLERQRKTQPTKIEFQIDGAWRPAGTEYLPSVAAVRLSRFTGSVRIEFDRPRRVKLADADWQDTYMSRAACRNVVIDLLENDDRSEVFREARVRYDIVPE